MPPLRLVALPVLTCLLLGASGEHRNRLASEGSPYLQLHASNPVDWYPWGEEAFAKARAEDKPVFLSVGYSTCYWCHVMEREVFSDPEIAASLNARFVSIKVDREERPDIDRIYMRATQLLTGSGGWPNSVFLTPEGQPFYAGTYFPPEDQRGQPGFPRVLDALAERWSQDRARVLETAARLTREMEALDAAGAPAAGPLPSAEALLDAALDALAADFDVAHGGFGARPKFPRAPLLELLLARADQARAREMLVASLDAMALGGLYDQVGDGFHRYATDAGWSLPHFEKMLYDNAQLASVYARAWARTGRPLYRRVARRTLAWLEREMSLPGGGFAAAQDASVDGVEGASYVWTRARIEAVLGAERARAFLTPHELVALPGHAEGGVLRVKRPLAERLAESGADDAAALLARFDADRARLLSARGERPQPLRDDKLLASWNGLAIRALVDAAGALGDDAYLRRAERAADFVVETLLDESGELQRSFVAGQRRERGVLDDYAHLADALLALHDATGEARWLASARVLADALLERFEAPDGGFFLTPEGSGLLLRPRSFEDDALPSGNGVALSVLRRLAARTGSARYAEAAARSAAAAAAPLERAPQALATAVAALATTPDPRAQPAPRMPRSQDHVRVRALRGDAAGAFRVEVEIDEGWHVNANPASQRFLIPTEVELPGGAQGAHLSYPEGRDFAPAFAEEPIRVYEGRVEIGVRLGEAAALPERVEVRYQACDETRCLPPHRESVALEKESPR